MVVAKPIRFLALATFCIFVYIVFILQRSDSSDPSNPKLPYDPARKFRVDKTFVEPNLEPSGEPDEPLVRVSGDNYAPGNLNSARTNATLLSLVRNSELDDMISSMRDLERTFNHKFNYPWLFLNDEPFTDEFKRRISAETKAQVTFGKLNNVERTFKNN
jgi:mannosyltransferase